MKCDGVVTTEVSMKKMNPFTVPFSLTHMGSALLATELVRILMQQNEHLFGNSCTKTCRRVGWVRTTQSRLLVRQAIPA